MQLSIKYESPSGKIDIMNSKIVRLVSINGVSPSAVVNTSEISGFDGATYLNSIVGKRSITIVLGFRQSAENTPDAEKAKYILYSVFALKKKGELIYTAKKRSLKIGCYVEKVEIPPNVHPMQAVISLICPDPYFHDITDAVAWMYGKKKCWKFPFTIPNNREERPYFAFSVVYDSQVSSVSNNGEIATGCVFVLTASGTVVNPLVRNINTFEEIALNYIMVAGDEIRINTNKGEKSIVLIRDKMETNIINYKKWGSVFLQLEVGENEFLVDAEAGIGALSVQCLASAKYGGV